MLLSTNDGTTLLGANCDTTYYDDIGGWDIRCLEPVPNDETVDASVRSASGATSPSTTSATTSAGCRSSSPPASAGSSTSTGCARSSPSTAARRRPSGRCGLGIVCWWVLAVAAVVGWRVARPAGRRRAGAVPRPWWLVVPLGAVLVTTVLFYGAHRIRAPAEPVVVVLAAVGAVAAWERWRPVR